MPGIIVVGTQWGDEGKGKATDQLGTQVDVVVKFNGGNNAGHTVVIGDETYTLHLLPAGILSESAVPVIGNGVVVDPEGLFAEIEAMEARGVDCSRLKISANAHVITRINRYVDQATEKFLGAGQIGTTGRGIGPTYADKSNRIGIRIQDLLSEGILRARIERTLHDKNQALADVGHEDREEAEQMVAELLAYGQRIAPMIADTSLLVNDALDQGQTVLFEAGQAAMLDIDHGTYPFVTSSSATAGGALTGAGVGPTRIDRVVGVAKAYVTRVGEGPFPTELFGPAAKHLRELGGEYGATTGRPRRVGWADGVVLRYATRVNGLTDVVLTKLDVLDGYKTLPVAVGYDIDGEFVTEMPVTQVDFARAQPVYEELPGWQEDIRGIRRYDDLPTEARDYVEFLEGQARCRISSIGVGPGREETIVRRSLL